MPLKPLHQLVLHVFFLEKIDLFRRVYSLVH